MTNIAICIAAAVAVAVVIYLYIRVVADEKLDNVARPNLGLYTEEDA